MDTFLYLLRVNGILVYFAYGLVFFVLGLAIALTSRQSRRRSRLAIAHPIGWLAGFGFTHAAYEWGNVFIPIQATYLPAPAADELRVAQLVLLAVSYALLFQFGALAAVGPSLRRWALRATPVVLLVFGGVILALVAVFPVGPFDLSHAEAWIRRLLGVTAAALAGYGMLRQAGSVDVGGRWISRYFQLAAMSFGAYAVLTGLVGPESAQSNILSPGYHPIHDLPDFSVPVLRSLAGLGIAVGIVRGLEVFELETAELLAAAQQQRLEAAERARQMLCTISAAVDQPLLLGESLELALAAVLDLTRCTVGWVSLSEADGRLVVSAVRGPRSVCRVGNVCAPTERCACSLAVEQNRVVGAATGGCHTWPDKNALPFGFLSVPLVSPSRVAGVLCLGQPSEGGFDRDEIALLGSVGQQIGLAVENTRKGQELRRKEVGRVHLLKRLITAQEEERRRVALELHDDTGQSLSAVIMGLGAARDAIDHDLERSAGILDETRELAVRTLQGVRELILGLRPASLDDLGLVPALHQLADDLRRRSGAEVLIDCGKLDGRLLPEVETVLFRIVQEGLNNIAQHAAASHVSLCLRTVDGLVQVTLEDDGAGFDPEAVNRDQQAHRAVGLLGMQERAGLLGGEVVVRSAPGCGTRLHISLPTLASTVV